jgi:hypothetical protein
VENRSSRPESTYRRGQNETTGRPPAGTTHARGGGPVRQRKKIEKGRDLAVPPLRDIPAASYSPVTPTVTVPSALRGLTAVFGMGTGVSPSPWRPETLRAAETAARLKLRQTESRVFEKGGLRALVRSMPVGRPRISDTDSEAQFRPIIDSKIELIIDGQAARPISTGQLHTLQCFHLRPINLLVWKGPLGSCDRDT